MERKRYLQSTSTGSKEEDEVKVSRSESRSCSNKHSKQDLTKIRKLNSSETTCTSNFDFEQKNCHTSTNKKILLIPPTMRNTSQSQTQPSKSKQIEDLNEQKQQQHESGYKSSNSSRASTPNSTASGSSLSTSTHSSNEYACTSTKATSTVLKKTKNIHPAKLIPLYLRDLVQHSHSDYFVSNHFCPNLIAQLMCEGFLPISTSRFLLPKLHKERCVIYPLRRTSTATSTSTMSLSNMVHTSKSTKKKLKRFNLTINQDFDGVVAGCHGQHGISWLYPKIVSSFKYMHEQTKQQKPSHSHTIESSSSSSLNDASLSLNSNDERKENQYVNQNNHHQTQMQKGLGITAKLYQETQHQHQYQLETIGSCQVKLYSIEVWNAQTGELSGGELGYSVGTIYTSLTGFSTEDSAGSVQLAALGKLLGLCGYEMWDLGMSLDYKKKLGARNMERSDFLSCVNEMRVKHPHGMIIAKDVNGIETTRGMDEVCQDKVNCKEIFEMT